MISREELKREVDKLPESLLKEVYAFLKRVIPRRKEAGTIQNAWQKWRKNLDKFTPDFMGDRGQPPHQTRESLDS